MTNSFYNFKIRMGEDDWHRLSSVMRQSNPFYTRKGQRDWTFNQVNRFVIKVAIPWLRCMQSSGMATTMRVQKSIMIQETPIEGKTNVQWLKEFAEHKQMPVAQAIEWAIIHKNLSIVDYDMLARYENFEATNCDLATFEG